MGSASLGVSPPLFGVRYHYRCPTCRKIFPGALENHVVGYDGKINTVSTPPPTLRVGCVAKPGVCLLQYDEAWDKLARLAGVET